MLKNVIKITIIMLISIILVTVAGYYAISGYYGSRFLCGTTINGRDISAMTVEEANDYLVSKYLPGVDYSNVALIIEGRDGYSEIIRSSDFGLKADMTEGLKEIIEDQKPYEWLLNYMYPTAYNVEPSVSYDDAALRECVAGLKCMDVESENLDPHIEIKAEKTGYSLYDDIKDRADENRVYGKAKEALEDPGRAVIEIDINDSYIPHKIPDEFKDTVELYDKIDKVARAYITYEDAPIKYTLKGSTAVNWLEKGDDGMPVTDENGNLVFDELKIEEYTERLAEVFDTKDGMIDWRKRDGEIVSLKNALEGYQVDQEAEAGNTKETLLRGGQITRQPIYAQKGRGRGNDVIGKTYVEVDMSAQKLYYMVDGRLKMQSDVVTGNIARGNGTPAKLCYVYFKQRNRTLRGPNYATFVSYWMAVSGHIGIHDATWRNKFGGEIYKTAGSHGCVNVPKDFAAKLYDVLELGTPVIMYY